MFGAIRRWSAGLWNWFRSLFSLRLPPPELGGPETFRKTRTTGRILWRGGALLLVFLMLFWTVHLLWHALWIRGYSLSYPKAVFAAEAAIQQKVDGVKVCKRSQVVAVQTHLIDFVVNENAWMPSLIEYKTGFFGILGWESTPFLDNKAAFQLGILSALRRTGVELTDVLGRVRGTSGADQDLLFARNNLHTDERTWWFNPFDKGRLFGPVQPSSSIYRKAIPLYQSFNDRLAGCQATFDARADNLLDFIESIAQDTGSTVDGLVRQSQGTRYDTVNDVFVDGNGNDRGWFDMHADDIFMYASGQMYAYHGLLQAARLDFADVESKRELKNIWDALERHVAEAAALSPAIISNGREDGFLMPDHLSVLAQNILRARTNLTEMRDVLRQ